MSSDPAEDEWVELARQGDGDAFGLLVGRYQSRVLAHAMRYTRNREDALEIAQEAFIRAWTGLAKFRADSSFYTWLYRIVRNSALNYLAAARNRPHALLDGGDDEGESTPAALVEHVKTPLGNLQRDELSDYLQRALRELPRLQQQALLLREMEGLSYEQVAEVMDIPIGTVRSRIYRARETLLKGIQRLHTTEGFDG